MFSIPILQLRRTFDGIERYDWQFNSSNDQYFMVRTISGEYFETNSICLYQLRDSPSAVKPYSIAVYLSGRFFRDILYIVQTSNAYTLPLFENSQREKGCNIMRSLGYSIQGYY